MARNLILTEEQYQLALKEGVSLNADVSAAGGDVKKAVDTTKQEAQKNRVDLKNATISIKASDTNEGIVISKKELTEMFRLNKNFK